jgi:hypothetical protein
MWQNITDLLFIPGEVIVNLFVSLALASALSIGIALLYRSTHRGLNYEQSFLSTLVLLSPIVTLVMMFIRGDLVLSLGLVGSLSIIRFRTPIKDTRDMVFLFWVIAVGLGCGTDNWMIAVVATLFLSIVTALLYIMDYGTQRHADFVLVLAGESDYASEEVQDVIRQHTTTARVRSFETEGEAWETVFELRFNRMQEKQSDQMVRSIKAVQGVAKVSLLAPQLTLPM